MPELHYSIFGKIAPKLRQWASEWLVMSCNWYLKTAESYFLTRAEKKPGWPLRLYQSLYEAKFASIPIYRQLFPKRLIGIWRRKLIAVGFILLIGFFFRRRHFWKVHDLVQHGEAAEGRARGASTWGEEGNWPIIILWQ